MKQPPFYLPKIFRWQNFVSVHIMIEGLKTSHKIGRSFHKFSCKSGAKWKNWTLNWNSHENFEKNIQIVKLHTIWTGIWKYIIKTTGLFISFFAKTLQSWENKKLQKWKIWTAIIFYKSVYSNVILTICASV